MPNPSLFIPDPVVIGAMLLLRPRLSDFASTQSLVSAIAEPRLTTPLLPEGVSPEPVTKLMARLRKEYNLTEGILRDIVSLVYSVPADTYISPPTNPTTLSGSVPKLLDGWCGPVHHANFPTPLHCWSTDPGQRVAFLFDPVGRNLVASYDDLALDLAYKPVPGQYPALSWAWAYLRGHTGVWGNSKLSLEANLIRYIEQGSLTLLEAAQIVAYTVQHALLDVYKTGDIPHVYEAWVYAETENLYGRRILYHPAWEIETRATQQAEQAGTCKEMWLLTLVKRSTDRHYIRAMVANMLKTDATLLRNGRLLLNRAGLILPTPAQNPVQERHEPDGLQQA